MEQNSNKQDKRKLIHSKDIIIILVLLIIAFVVFSYLNKERDNGGIAQITYEGKVVKTIDLNTAQSGIFTLVENKNVSFEIKEKEIRYINVKCPDKICENVGFISNPNETAICMPNKVSVTILEDETKDAPDAVVK